MIETEHLFFNFEKTDAGRERLIDLSLACQQIAIKGQLAGVMDQTDGKGIVLHCRCAVFGNQPRAKGHSQ